MGVASCEAVASTPTSEYNLVMYGELRDELVFSLYLMSTLVLLCCRSWCANTYSRVVSVIDKDVSRV